MNIYTPTWLYIKHHTVTGLKYFGKTTQDPYTYKGSGVYWNNHLRKHGEHHVATIWCQLFLDKQSLTEYAIQFSTENNIIESAEWANLMIENGQTGGRIMITDEGRQKITDSKKGKARPQSVIDRLTGCPKTLQHKENISNATGQGWIIENIETGSIIQVSSLKKWCRDNKISSDMLYRNSAKNKSFNGIFAKRSD